MDDVIDVVYVGSFARRGQQLSQSKIVFQRASLVRAEED